MALKKPLNSFARARKVSHSAAKKQRQAAIAKLQQWAKDIMREFHISTALGQWLTNGYMLVNGIMVPLTAFLIQRLTTRTLYLTAVGLFAVGTITAGFAPNFEILITGLVTALFVLHQLHTSTPLLNMSVFSHREFNVAVLINIVLMMAMYGGALMLPLYMQNVRGASAFISGLVLFPGALVTAFLSPWSGRLYDRYGAKYLTLTGILITAIGTFILASLTLTTPLWFAVIGQFVRQLGLVLVLMPIQTEAFNALPLTIIPDGSAMFTTIRQLAASFGIVMTYGFIGAGNMATAMMKGLLHANVDPADIYVSSPHRAKTLAEELHINAADSQTVIDHSDIVVLAFLPNQLTEIGAMLNFTNKIVVSVLAQITIADLNQAIQMRSMFALCQTSTQLSASVTLAEEQFAIFSAIAGSGPAYVFKFIDALTKAGVCERLG
ncbi:hypothetical protein Pfo_031506 [Paulownia fortunei]|nr:hypothetical protein Pfo_031506 [Paulownia fortunei]